MFESLLEFRLLCNQLCHLFFREFGSHAFLIFLFVGLLYSRNDPLKSNLERFNKIKTHSFRQQGSDKVS